MEGGHKVGDEEKKKKYSKVLDSHNSNDVGLHPSLCCPGRGPRLLGGGEQGSRGAGGGGVANQLLLTFSSQAAEEKKRTDAMAAAAARVAAPRRRLTEPRDKTGLESNRPARRRRKDVASACVCVFVCVRECVRV